MRRLRGLGHFSVDSKLFKISRKTVGGWKERGRVEEAGGEAEGELWATPGSGSGGRGGAARWGPHTSRTRASMRSGTHTSLLFLQAKRGVAFNRC